MTRLFWNASSRNVLTCNFLAPQKVEEKRFCLFFQKNNSPFKTRIATACACPKMFATEQRYSPESDPLTLFKSKFLLETAEWLICDWLRFILLHTTAGSGLPLTEHWNEAVFFFIIFFLSKLCLPLLALNCRKYCLPQLLKLSHNKERKNSILWRESNVRFAEKISFLSFLWKR